MGKTQRYQAAVIGQEKPHVPLGVPEKGYASRPPKPEYGIQSGTAELLRVQLRSVCIHFDAGHPQGVFIHYGNNYHPFISKGQMTFIVSTDYPMIGDIGIIRTWPLIN